MRWNAVFLFLLSLSCFGQEKADSTNALTDSLVTISRGDLSYQEILVRVPWNGLIISTLENPAFSGFDRALQSFDSFSVENSNVRNQNPIPLGFWNLQSTVDVAFGGQRKNIGLNFSFDQGSRISSKNYRINLAVSYKVHLAERHKLIIGVGARYIRLTNQNEFGTFPDMLDPRYGWVYPTQEKLPESDQQEVYGISVGLIYVWNRLFIEYAFRYEPRSMIAAGTNDMFPVNRLSASYLFKANSEVSLMPVFKLSYDLFRVTLNPGIGLDWNRKAFVILSAPSLTRIKLDIGGQFWKRFRLNASVSTFYKPELIQNNGYSFSVGARYQILNY